MNKNTLITNYNIKKFKFQNIHSVGHDQYFNNPFVAYIKKGYAKFLYKGKTIYAHNGDLIYIASGTKYASIWFGSPDVEWITIAFNFKSQYDFYEYPFQILKNYPSDLFDKIYETYENSYLLSVSYFYQLLDDIHKKLKPADHILYKSVEPAIIYIENNYNKSISVNYLAKLCSCSESSLYKTFKKATGVTPVAYKHNIMIQHALELLSHTNHSIEEISSHVGFSSSNYFRTVFIKLTGKTPKELR